VKEPYTNGSTKKAPKKVLFLTHRFPYPLIGGDRIKAYHLLRHLSEIATVDVIALDEAQTCSLESVAAMSKLATARSIAFSKVKAGLRILGSLLTSTPIEFAYYNSPEMQREVDTALANNHYDLVIAFFLRTAIYLKQPLTIPKLLVAEDARVILQERATEHFSLSPEYIVRKIDANRLATFEPKVMTNNSFAKVTFVATEDEKRIKQAAPNLKTAILTNGVDTEYFQFFSGPRENKLVFVGNLSVYHNKLMAERLLTKIFPALKKQFPDLKVTIVGKSPTKKLKKLVVETNGAELHADVADTRPFLNSAKVFVHPQAVGAGIQNKLLEAMAIGVPIVTTSVGASGIQGTEHRIQAWIGDSDEALIAGTAYLLQNEQEARTLALNARALVEKRYTWDRIFQDLDEILDEIAPGFVESNKRQSFSQPLANSNTNGAPKAEKSIGSVTV